MHRAAPLFLLALALSGADLREPLFQQGKLRALILSGRNNHDWRATTPLLKNVLIDSGRFDVRVNEEPTGASAATLSVYDVLVVDYCGPRWGEITEKAVQAFVSSGKGLVVFHAASYPFGDAEILAGGSRRTGVFEPPWMEYRKMVGAWWSKADPPITGHGQRHTFRVKFSDRRHPIALGMEETFLATDELYHNFRMLPGVEVLATAYDDPKMGGTGKDEPILWTVRYGQGRVFHTALGHDLPALVEPGFIATFARGAEWAASGAVTLPPRIEPPKPAVRAMVVTGAHDYEPSFYTVFEGHQDLSWRHAASNKIAFKDDFRKKYDVLVLYDMHQEISETERKNLVDFVESGKGLVILHHAIADYNGWEWWWKEVAGGKYRLKPEGSTPRSTFKHDIELFVQPVAKHPILAGMGPLHIFDEGYKGMWISPASQVLLTTDHPAADPAVAWISPYQKSRVAVILLGHDRLAHIHPGFRQLVKNAILWAAGA